jgi:hypothetical protein
MPRAPLHATVDQGKQSLNGAAPHRTFPQACTTRHTSIKLIAVGFDGLLVTESDASGHGNAQGLCGYEVTTRLSRSNSTTTLHYAAGVVGVEFSTDAATLPAGLSRIRSQTITPS